MVITAVNIISLEARDDEETSPTMGHVQSLRRAKCSGMTPLQSIDFLKRSDDERPVADVIFIVVRWQNSIQVLSVVVRVVHQIVKGYTVRTKPLKRSLFFLHKPHMLKRVGEKRRALRQIFIRSSDTRRCSSMGGGA